MQVSVTGLVGQPLQTRPLYQLCHLEYNKIGDEGCKHLSKAAWINLHTLDLGIICVI